VKTIVQIQEERAAIFAKMQDVINAVDGEKGIDTPEGRAKYDAMEADLQGKSDELRTLERNEELRKSLAAVHAHEPIVDPSDPAARGAGGSADPEERAKAYSDAFMRYAQHGQSALSEDQAALLIARANASDWEQRDQGIATGGAGGYLVPQDFLHKLTEVQKWFGGMLDVANVIDTTTGAPLPWPGNDDTGNVGAILGENQTITQQDVVFTAKTLNAFVYTSKLMKVSFQLAQDSAFDLSSFLAKKGGQRLGRIHNTHFTTGDGANKPSGLLSATIGLTAGKTAASSTTWTWQEGVDTIHSVDAAYRNSGNCRWMFHDLMQAFIHEMVDGNGRPLWTPGVGVGNPDTFLGYPITINNDFNSARTTGQIQAAFGDFNQAYLIRRVHGAQLLTLRERYADQLQTGYFIFDRMDGMCDDTSAAKTLVLA